MTSSVSPRVFISTPSAAAWRCGTCESRAAASAPRNLPPIATTRISSSSTTPAAADAAHVHLEPGDHEEHRQQQQDADLLEPFQDGPGERAAPCAA